MIFRDHKNTDAEAIEYLKSLDIQHINTITAKLDDIFRNGIKSVADVYTAHTLLTEYKNITGNEYSTIKEDSIV